MMEMYSVHRKCKVPQNLKKRRDMRCHTNQDTHPCKAAHWFRESRAEKRAQAGRLGGAGGHNRLGSLRKARGTGQGVGGRDRK